MVVDQLLARAESPRHTNGKHACGVSGLHIRIGIAKVQALFRSGAECVCNRERTDRRRLSRDFCGLPLNPVEKARSVHALHDVDGRLVRLVGTYGNRNFFPQRGQGFPHIRIRFYVIQRVLVEPRAAKADALLQIVELCISGVF